MDLFDWGLDSVNDRHDVERMADAIGATMLSSETDALLARLLILWGPIREQIQKMRKPLPDGMDRVLGQMEQLAKNVRDYNNQLGE